MESNHDTSTGALRQQARIADRAAAAPFIEQARDPWWVPAAYGGLAALIVLGFARLADPAAADRTTGFIFVATVFLSLGLSYWLTRHRGVQPRGTAPVELRPVLRWTLAGTVVATGGCVALGLIAPLWLGLPVAFLLGAGGMAWSARAHHRASTRAAGRLR